MGCGITDNGDVYYGSTPKYRLDIEAELPMSDFDFEADLICGERHITIEKGSMPKDSSGNYYVCFDTKNLGIGPVKAVITAKIPDEAFRDKGGIRKEIYVIDRLTVIRGV